MSVEWRFDTNKLDNSLAKLGGDIDPETVMALEAALVTIFNATQQSVHVITGRLKASGRMESSVDRDSWEGSITYGGPGTGVEYAFYEQRRGGHHDYMQIGQDMDDVLLIAFRTGLEG